MEQRPKLLPDNLFEPVGSQEPTSKWRAEGTDLVIDLGESTTPSETILGRAQREDEAERTAATPVGSGYTGEACVVCGRIRVFVRADGRQQCEKCESFQEVRLQ